MSINDPKRQVADVVHSVNGDTMQALPPKDGATTDKTLSGTSQEIDITGAQFVRITALSNARIKFGASPVTATSSDILFSTGTEILVVPKGADAVAVIQNDVADTDTISVTEMGG